MDPVFWNAKSSPTGVGVELAPVGEDAIRRRRMMLADFVFEEGISAPGESADTF